MGTMGEMSIVDQCLQCGGSVTHRVEVFHTGEVWTGCGPCAGIVAARRDRATLIPLVA